MGSTISAAASVRHTASALRGRALPTHSYLYTKQGVDTCHMLAQWLRGGPGGDPTVRALGLNRGSTKGASLVGAVRDSRCLRWWRCRGRQRDVAPSLATPCVQSSRSQRASILVVRYGGLEGALSGVEAWQHIASSVARGFHHGAQRPANVRPYGRPAGGPLVGGLFGTPAMGRTNLAAGRDVEVLCESGWRRGTVELVYSDKILVKFHSPSPTTTTTQPPVDHDESYYTPGAAAAISAVQRHGVAAASKAAVAAGVEEGGVGGAKLSSWRDWRVHASHASHARGLVTALPAGAGGKGTPEAQEGLETTSSALSRVSKETWRRAASRSTCWRSNICRILPASCLLLLRSCCSSCWLRAIVSSTSKETYYGEKIDLLYAEKRPAICGKETYYMPTFESLPAGCAQSLP